MGGATAALALEEDVTGGGFDGFILGLGLEKVRTGNLGLLRTKLKP